LTGRGLLTHQAVLCFNVNYKTYLLFCPVGFHPHTRLLTVDDFLIDDFHYLVSNVVHPLNP
jgi:hypothetical protein